MNEAQEIAALLLAEIERHQDAGATITWGDRALKALLRGMSGGDVILTTALNILDVDGHVYGKRPCSTCDKISAIAGKPFGCSARRKE